MHDSKDPFTIQSLDKKTFQSLIIKGADFLKSYNISNSKNEIEWFLQDLYQYDKLTLYENNNLLIDVKYYNIINNFIYQRSKGVPFQHLLNKAPFYGRAFIVGPKVLIPRPESETLIDIIKNQKYKKLLDIGTGSGVIAITVDLENIAESIDAIDINLHALNIAKKNQIKLNSENVNFIKLDILKSIPNSKYDIIVSNPPYVSLKEYNNLDLEIQDHEPSNAITDFQDGFTFYKRYAFILKQLLNPKGIAVFELSHGFKKDDLKKIFIDFNNIKFYNDLNNDFRFIKIIL